MAGFEAAVDGGTLPFVQYRAGREQIVKLQDFHDA
jgi:hypothetical protein